DDQRGAGGHDRSGQERHDHDGGHPRDGVRPAGGPSRDLHGWWAGGRRGGSRDVLRLAQVRPVAAILVEDTLALGGDDEAWARGPAGSRADGEAAVVAVWAFPTARKSQGGRGLHT